MDRRTRSCPPIYCSNVQYTRKKVDQGMRRKHAGRIALPCGGVGKKCVWNSYTPEDQRCAYLVHQITEVWDGRRLVCVRGSVLVRRRARMVMWHRMRHLHMQEPGRNAERRQQHEHTVGGAQTQRPQPTPVLVAQAVVALHRATERVQLWPSMTHQSDRSSRASSGDRWQHSSIASCRQQRKERYFWEGFLVSGLCVGTERKPGKCLLPLPLPPFCPAEPLGSNDLKPVPIDTVSGSIPRDCVPLPAAPSLHAAAVWQTRSSSVSYGVYGRPCALACAPRPDRPSSAQHTYPFSDATASSGMPWPWRSATSTQARSGWVPSLTSMLAVPVVTTVRKRSSHGSERASDRSRIRF
jgi:hypothetical protein